MVNIIKEELPIEELLNYISAPDFPTGGIIMGTQQAKRAYLTGMGTVTVRAKTEIVKLKNKKPIRRKLAYFSTQT